MSNSPRNSKKAPLHYCAKEMQTKFGVFRSLFSPKIRRNLATKFCQSAREFSLRQTKFRCRLGEISHPLKRNFVMPKFRRSENSQLRKFAAAQFPQSEILVAVEEGCSENLSFGTPYTISPSNLFSLDFSRTRGFRGDSFHVSQKQSCFIIRRDISFGSER